MDSWEHEKLSEALEARMRDRGDGLVIPPPAFKAMQGEFVEFDEANQTLTARFPVR
jgi:hypothetical protein